MMTEFVFFIGLSQGVIYNAYVKA